MICLARYRLNRDHLSKLSEQSFIPFLTILTPIAKNCCNLAE